MIQRLAIFTRMGQEPPRRVMSHVELKAMAKLTAQADEIEQLFFQRSAGRRDERESRTRDLEAFVVLL